MPHDTPSWLKSSSLYQVYIRNFTPEGTFASAIPRLKGIRDIGFDIVYLMPIHPVGTLNRKGALGSPYAVADYRSVDPGLGDMGDLRRFLAEAHAAGLKVIMDVVFNHTACDSLLLREHPEWFMRDAKGGPARKVPDWSDVFDLDFSHRGLREYLVDTLAGWVEAGFDGFRCDVASLVPVDFWIEARARIGEKKPLVWLAESVEKGFVKHLRDMALYAASDPELHAAFDVTYDYDGFEYLKEYFLGGLGLEAYLRHVLVQETLYPAHALKARFLENHDQQRAAAVIRGPDRLKNWTAFSWFLPGLIFVYMGQEHALVDRPDLFRKDPVRWEEGSKEFFDFFRKLLPICMRAKAETGIFHLVEICAGVLALRWSDRAMKTRITAIVNLEDRFGEKALPFALRGRDLLTSAVIDLAGGPDAPKTAIPKGPLIVRES